MKVSHCCIEASRVPEDMSGLNTHRQFVQLAAMRARDPAAKALIFTQFIGTLDWLAQRLQEEGYGYRTISGSMPLKKRAQVLMLSHLAADILQHLNTSTLQHLNTSTCFNLCARHVSHGLQRM